MFIFHLSWVGLSITKYAVWVVPLALCCEIGCGGQHVINELQLKFQSLGLFDHDVIPRWLLPRHFPFAPASKLLYANYIHRYCTFHNMLTIICTRCFFSTLSVPNHVDDNTHIPCLLNTTLPVSLCIWNLEGLCLLHRLLGWKLSVRLDIQCWLSTLGIIIVVTQLSNPGYHEINWS